MNQPHISSEEYAQRRQRLMQRVDENSLIILASSTLKTRNHDAEFIFRQDSDFHYFTGFNEPEAVAVLIPQREEGEFVLFCRERDPQAEQWVGRRAGLEGVKADYGADESFAITELEKQLPELMADRDVVYYRIGFEVGFDQTVIQALNQTRKKVRQGIKAPTTFKSLDEITHEMRLIKSEAELDMMRHAAKVSAQAHTQAMQQCQVGMNEYEIEAIYQHAFRKQGMREAYASIVAGGKNACILHYIENNQPLNDGDLLLIDAGAEHDCYASDITRTFPVNGKFSAEQQALYEIVLAANKAAIEATKAGESWNKPHEVAVDILVDGLLDLGLLTEDRETVMDESLYRRFYMHNTGHWLGLDVHDAGCYKVDGEWRSLEKGMVLTIEPGLYIPADDDIDAKWHNIGIRIEDDVIVTEIGCEVITSDVVKEVDEIEALMKKD